MLGKVFLIYCSYINAFLSVMANMLLGVDQLAHSPCQNNLLGVQARQLGDGATLLVTEQVVILVRGHVHRRMSHELAHRR